MAILRAAQRARAEGEAVDIRLAIHVGEVVVGQASGTAEMALESKQESWALLGALVAQAEPNSIVVSEAAVQFLEPRFDLLPGEAGPALPGRTYRLVGLEPVGARAAPPAGPLRRPGPRAGAGARASSPRPAAGTAR